MMSRSFQSKGIAASSWPTTFCTSIDMFCSWKTGSDPEGLTPSSSAHAMRKRRLRGLADRAQDLRVGHVVDLRPGGRGGLDADLVGVHRESLATQRLDARHRAGAHFVELAADVDVLRAKVDNQRRDAFGLQLVEHE